MQYLFALFLFLLPVAAAPQTIDDHSVTCLARTVYFEARGEPLAAQKAVAEVVMNRVQQGFAPSICGVVYQRRQFSWTTRPARVREAAAYARARDLSIRLLAGFEPRHDRRSTYFYSGRRRPTWAKKMWPTERIGKHLFLW
jgi:N-acetylmuramoyl-L-alanine amidase